MNHLKRSLLFVPLLAVAMLAFASTSYAHASPFDHGGVTAASVGATAHAVLTPVVVHVDAAVLASAEPVAVDNLRAEATATARATVHRDTGDQRLTADLAINHYGDHPASVADDRRSPVALPVRYVEDAVTRGSPPYLATLTTLTYSTVTITPDGAILVRPQRLNC